MKAGELSEPWICPECSGDDGEWFDCDVHYPDECFVLRCHDCNAEWYDHDDEEE